jgi:REP element-mobilizing transposase RayT
MSLPKRKRLPHEVPLWIHAEDEVYFITICCRPPGQNQLCHEPVAAALFETVEFRTGNGTWYPHVFLLMPDHAHTLVSFPEARKTMTAAISQWKEWTAKKLGIQWQTDFFEHRLRGEEGLRQKTDYILHNPVRKGLVQRAEDWRYIWFPR